MLFQIISGRVWARFSSYPGIPTPASLRFRWGWHACWESVCIGGEGGISFRWWRKPECPEKTTGQLRVTVSGWYWGFTPGPPEGICQVDSYYCCGKSPTKWAKKPQTTRKSTAKLSHIARAQCKFEPPLVSGERQIDSIVTLILSATGGPRVRRLLTTFSLIDRPIHIGEKLIGLRWPLIH